MSSDQSTIASLNDVKLRLGAVNQFGKQKGVDSLIVTDLIELARLNSISDAFLLSGDEDVRVGVQIAQNYGVRLHLLRIESNVQPCSEMLLREADTASLFLTKGKIKKFLHYAHIEKIILDVVQSFVASLTSQEKNKALEHWNADIDGIPRFLDEKLLCDCRDRLERKLEWGERKFMRSCFKDTLTKDTKT